MGTGERSEQLEVRRPDLTAGETRTRFNELIHNLSEHRDLVRAA